MATKEEELQKKREEAERKARRGEIDPTHEFTFQVSISIYSFLGAECKLNYKWTAFDIFCLIQIVAQLSGLLRHEIMDFMFSNPTMLDDLDFLYKSDTARKLMFYYQVTLLAFQIQCK